MDKKMELTLEIEEVEPLEAPGFAEIGAGVGSGLAFGGAATVFGFFILT
jgi:hypothetical protein